MAKLALLVMFLAVWSNYGTEGQGFSVPRASSKLNDFDNDFGPEKAIDGKISEEHRHFFHSKWEDNPWLEVSIPEGWIRGVEIVTRYGCCADRVRDLEFRAGLDTVPSNYKGKLTFNSKVAAFAGPADKNLETYIITFDRKVHAKYVTIQRMGDNVTLEINEIRMIMVEVFSSSRASSKYHDDFGPEKAIDGKISEEHRHFFHSKEENNPWLEVSMPEGWIRGVEIVTRYGCCADRVRDLEFRAGLDTVPSNYKGKLTVNSKVATFAGPADKNLETYYITFERKVRAKYVTIQRMGDGVTLEINEIRMIMEACSIKNEDCQTGKGADYHGEMSQTKSGLECQAWNVQTPHKHSFGEVGNHNQCRNPNGEPGAWCYTTNPAKRWELCDIEECSALDIFFLEYGNGAANCGRDYFNAEYVEAATAAIEAEDLFHAGLYKEANDKVKDLWKKHPTGSEVWDRESMTPKIQGWSWAHPYALLRMVEDMSSFRLTADNVPASPKNQMVITVVLAEMETILPRSWNDFSLEDGTMKENFGVSKTIPFYEKMLDDDYKIIRENLKAWIAYLENVVAQGHIDFQVKVVKTVKPLNCSIRLKENQDTKKFDLKEFETECHYRSRSSFLTKLPNDAIGDSHWYMLVHPHYAKELRGFEDFQSFNIHTDDRSMGGITASYQYFPLFIMHETFWLETNIENLSGGFRDLSEVERRLWWPKWTMHEMFHYLFGVLYKYEELEREAHQWFNRTKWPQDFDVPLPVWRENDYFHQAMFRRFLRASPPPYEKILSAVGIRQKGRAKASSSYDNAHSFDDNDAYKPVYAIDGKISRETVYFFHSTQENYPWFQLWIPEGYVTGVKIVPRFDYDTKRFQNIEFRAGMTTVVDGFKGKLTINEKVGFFTGPAAPGQNYTILFDKTVLAKYITIQRMEENVILEINEVTLL